MADSPYDYIEALADAVTAAKAHRAWRDAGGVSAPFHGDFAEAMPSTLHRLEWYVRELRRQRDERNRALTDAEKLLTDAHVRNYTEQDEHSAQRAALVSERDKAVSSRDFCREWYAVRFERLRAWANDRLSPDLKHEYFSIVANGTAAPHEAPAYAQIMNVLRHQRDAALAEVARLQALAGGTHAPDQR